MRTMGIRLGILLAYAGSLIVALILLLLAYPWRISFGGFYFSRAKTISAYLIVASLMPLITITASWAARSLARAGGSRWPVLLLTAFFSTFAFALVGYSNRFALTSSE